MSMTLPLSSLPLFCLFSHFLSLFVLSLLAHPCHLNKASESSNNFCYWRYISSIFPVKNCNDTASIKFRSGSPTRTKASFVVLFWVPLGKYENNSACIPKGRGWDNNAPSRPTFTLVLIHFSYRTELERRVNFSRAVSSRARVEGEQSEYTYSQNRFYF